MIRDSKRLVLFDIDATILLTGGAGARAMERAGRELFGDDFSWEGVEPSGGLDPLLFEEAAHRNGRPVGPEDHRAFHDLYVECLVEELADGAGRVRLMPGILALLGELRLRASVVLGLLTGNYPRSAAMKLESVGIPLSWFEVSVFGSDAGSRPELVRVALERFRERFGESIPPRRVMVVGDTPRDVDCARSNGCRSLAVATGRFSVGELEVAGADVAVTDLDDPRPLWNLLEGMLLDPPPPG